MSNTCVTRYNTFLFEERFEIGRNRSVFSVLLLVAIFAAPAAYPKRIATNTNAFRVMDNAAHAIPLDGDGSTSMTFSLAGIYIISYNAECMAQGPVGSWLSVSILVDGEPTKPRSGTDFAFCSPTGPNSETYMAVVRTGIANVGVGNHVVQVIGTGVNTTLWQVDDSVLTVNRLNK